MGSGLQPWEFYDYTLNEFILRREGLHEKRKRELREEYQHTRILAYHVIAPYLDKSAKRKPINEIIPDIYDDNPAKVISLKDRYKNLLSRYEKAGIKLEPKQAASGSE